MKKLIKLFAIALLIFVSTKMVSAHPGHHGPHNFRIVASFGTFHQWGVPNRIINEVDFFYPYHQWVHVSRIRTPRSFFFNVVLERNGEFIELELARNGRILHASHYFDYPLINHVCSSFCGFHNGFYNTYRVHRGHRFFHARRHVYYRPNIVVVNVPRSYRARNRYFGYERYSRFGNGNHRYAPDSRRVARSRANNGNFRANNGRSRSYARTERSNARVNGRVNARSDAKTVSRSARSNANSSRYTNSRSSNSSARVVSNSSRGRSSEKSYRSPARSSSSRAASSSSRVSSRSSRSSSERVSSRTGSRSSSSRSSGRSSSSRSSRSGRN